jgi:DNA end-binding protein Ku
VDGEEVPYGDIAKGYELPDGEMVVLEDEDFANLPISTSRAVEVLSFVPAEQIDAVQLGKPYFCDPTGGDAKPYVLLRDSLERAGKVAVVKVALRQRERLAMLRARDGVLVLQTLLWPDEVREPRFDFLEQDVSIRAQELQMAESYIAALSADFEPGEYADHYREALEELIEAKTEGHEVKAPAEQPRTGQVVDLMEALRRSVAEAKSRRGEQPADDTLTRGAAAEADDAGDIPRKGGAAKRAAQKDTASQGAGSKGAATRGAASKGTASKGTASKGTARPATGKKAAVKKASAGKPAAKKTTAKKPTAKARARKATAKKATGRAAGRRSA